MYKRTQYAILVKRMADKRRFIQVIMGPRQVWKSTLMKQVVKSLDIPFLFYTADAVPVTEFKGTFNPSLSLVVGRGGMSAEEFLSMDPTDLFKVNCPI